MEGAPTTALNSHVLVLNRLWMAVRVIDARRAFSLLSRNLAEVIRVDDGSYAGYTFASWADISRSREFFPAEDDSASYDFVRSVQFDIAVPKVIRLFRYDRVPRQTVKLNRRNIFTRDRNQCQYCGEHFPTDELSLDHVMPRSQGGGASWTNLVCCCVACNSRKGGRTPQQAGMPLIRPAQEPRCHPVIHVRLGLEKYRSWRQFLDQAYWSVELH